MRPPGVHPALVGVVALVMALALAASVTPARGTTDEIVIRATGTDPPVLRTVAGRRVSFVNRAERPVHVEFGDDPRRHHVVQVPLVGPIWAIFHRPGTHPYVVHVYDGQTVILRGLVEVGEDPERPWGSGTCGTVVMGDCIEP
jgi:hypothetical protein